MAEDPLAPLSTLHSVAEAGARARTAVDAVLTNSTVRRRSPDVSAESVLRGAWASASLAGSGSTLADVRSGSAAGDPLVQGGLRVQSALAALADTWRYAPRQALARLHALAARDLAPADVLGRPGAEAGAGAAARLDTLSVVLATTTAPAVVVAAVVHGEILALDAFAPVSGLVARAAARLVLIERGLDPRSLVVLEVGHRELGEEYGTALDAYRSGSRDGLTRWLIHCADAVTAGAAETLAIATALARS